MNLEEKSQISDGGFFNALALVGGAMFFSSMFQNNDFFTYTGALFLIPNVIKYSAQLGYYCSKKIYK